LSFAFRKLRLQLFRDILGVGTVSAIGGLQSNLMVGVVTGVVGLFGANAIAGYGLGSRLDYLQIPLLFGLGTAVVTMIATNVGAGNIARAYAIAWRGALIAFIFTETLGLLVAAFPHAWLGLFTHDERVLAAGTLYLRAVAPFYGMAGVALMLYFAGQGLRKVVWPVLAGTLRFSIAAGAGFLLVVHWHQSMTVLFSVVAIGYCTFGAITAIATYLTERRDAFYFAKTIPGAGPTPVSSKTTGPCALT
jgi:Na+-driven multidrug efflux pump